VVPELDARLTAAKVGEILEFDAGNPQDPEVTIRFRVLVKDVKEQVLPDVDDEWANEASEFETVEELRADLRSRLASMKRVQGAMALRNEAVDALVQLVEEEPPEALVNAEVDRRLRDLTGRLAQQGATVEEYLEATEQDPQELVASLRGQAASAVKADLALRAVAEAQGIEVTDDDVEAEIGRLAVRFNQKPAALRRELERGDGLQAVRSDLKKGKALEWLVEHAEVVDEEGRAVDRSLLEPETPEDQDEEHGPEPEAASMAESAADPDQEQAT
jgi:trigger factor